MTQYGTSNITAPSINITASDNNITNASGNPACKGGNVNIAAGNLGNNSSGGTAGNVNITAGTASNASANDGNVNITGNNVFISADNISTDSANIANGTTLAVKNTNGWAELMLDCSGTPASVHPEESGDNHYNYIGFKNQKLKFCGDGGFDANCVLTLEDTPKGTITLGEGKNVTETPTIRTNRANQDLVLDAAGPLTLKSSESRAINFRMRNTNVEFDDSRTPNDGGTTNFNWIDITCSSDGTKVAAVSKSDGGGNIWISDKSGESWTKVTHVNVSGTKNWYGITSSADGTKLAAVVYNGNIYTSGDSGFSWAARASSKQWYNITSSADGTKLAAVVGGTGGGGNIWTSTNSGVTWNENTTSPGSTKNWRFITSSADGTKLAAVVTEGNIWTSLDSGSTWNEVSTADNPNWDNTQFWNGITMSENGKYLAATAGADYIYTSSDYGKTWTKNTTSPGVSRQWRNITSSASGTLLVATVANTAGETNSGIYLSNDGGNTWEIWAGSQTGQNWKGVATSADGTMIFAQVYGGKITRIHRGNLLGIDSPSPIGTLTIGDGSSATVPSLGNMIIMGMTEGNNGVTRRWMGMDLTMNSFGTGSSLFWNFGDCGASTNTKTSVDVKAFRIKWNAPANTLVVGRNGFAQPAVGIGTNTPAYPLEVATSTQKPAISTGGGSYYVSGPSDTLNANTNNWLTDTAARNVSIKTSNDIWIEAGGGSIIVGSDERIKKNITEVPDNLALQMLRDIDCNYYEYKDKIGAGTQQTIGFIAQQVKEHLPMAVSLQKSIIPNEMRVLEATWDGLKMSSNLTDVSGVKYRFYVSNDPSGNDEVKKEIVGNEDNTFTFDKHYNNVFCYGKEVDDFHTLDKQKLFTVNFSATQEIDKIQQEEKTKLAAAEERISALETENATLKAQLSSIEARLAALEA